MGHSIRMDFSEEYLKRIGDFLEALERLSENTAATENTAETGEEYSEAIGAAARAIEQALEEASGTFKELAEEFLPEHYDDIEWERADWRIAVLLATQKAAARAKDYGLRLTLEKAIENRRGRKWRKRIDDRVYLIRKNKRLGVRGKWMQYRKRTRRCASLAKSNGQA